MMAMSRTAASTRITAHDGSNSSRPTLNLAERGYAWWLLWRLSPPVTQARSRQLYAVFRKFWAPCQWPRPLMRGARTKT